jgi:hypothetical protein
LWTPLHMPSTPFYREPKGLLHSKIALESKEYSKWEHVHQCLLHLVICGANFIHLQADHLFTPWIRTFGTLSLTQFIHDSHPSFATTSQCSDSRLESPKPPKISEVSIVLKWQTDLQIWTLLAIFSPKSNRLANFPEIMKTNTSLVSFRSVSEFAKVLGSPKFWGWKGFSQFPNTHSASCLLCLAC